MADRDDKPRAHVIEPARSERSACRTCERPIAEGELRLSEAFVSDEGKWARAHQHARTYRRRELEGDDRRGYDSQNPDVGTRFHHLACAAQHQPYKLRSALVTSTLELPNRAELERAIERALSAVDVAEDQEATRDDYLAFIGRLREGPDDELQLVFGDWLQSVGDPRGELVAVQHAMEHATGDERLRFLSDEKKLIAQHRKQLMPDRFDGTLTWRRGFVDRVTLDNVETGSLERVFGHPSLRLVRELAVELRGSALVVTANLPTLPATLRVLELSNPRSGLGPIGPVLASALPQLVRLRLEGGAELDDVCHPTLVDLELVAADAAESIPATARGEVRSLVQRVAGLDRRNLPGLARVMVRAHRGLDAAVAALVRTNVVAGLHTLALQGDLSRAGAEPLRTLPNPLEVLDLRGTSRFGRTDLEWLAPIAREIVLVNPVVTLSPVADPHDEEWLVRHTRRAEWGIGRVIEETDQGLEVEFEHGGKKLVRNVELLEELERS